MHQHPDRALCAVERCGNLLDFASKQRAAGRAGDLSPRFSGPLVGWRCDDRGHFGCCYLVDDFKALLAVEIAVEEATAEQQAAAKASADNAIVTGEESVLIG